MAEHQEFEIIQAAPVAHRFSVTPVLTLVMVTVAPGSTAPLASETVPRTDPVTVWAMVATPLNNNTAILSHTAMHFLPIKRLLLKLHLFESKIPIAASFRNIRFRSPVPLPLRRKACNSELVNCPSAVSNQDRGKITDRTQTEMVRMNIL